MEKESTGRVEVAATTSNDNNTLDTNENTNNFVPNEEVLPNNLGEDSKTVSKQREVFSNNLIWRELSQYLSFSDLKETRLVSKIFHEKVMTQSSFLDDALVCLTVDRLDRFVFGTTAEKWKNFKIVVSILEEEASEDEWDDIDVDVDSDDDHFVDEEEDDEEEYYADKCMEVSDDEEDEDISMKKQIPDDDNFEWLYPLLHSAQHFIITVNVNCDSGFRLSPPLGILLDAPYNLRKLSIDTMIVTEDVEHVFGQISDNTRANMENLQEFEIFLHGNPDVLKPLSTYTSSTDSSDYGFSKFTGFLVPLLKNLQVLRVANLVYEKEYNLDNFQVNEDLHLKLQNLLTIIDNNKKSLKTLEINDLQLCSTSSNDTFHSIFKMSFPILNTLTIRVSQIESDNIRRFLKSQSPLLENLDMTILFNLPNDLWNSIRERSHNFKKLRIKTKSFTSPPENLWNFLSAAKLLKDIQIEFIEPKHFSQNSGPLKHVLSSLPRSVKKISFGAFQPYGALTALDFVNMQNPINLTQLKLTECEHSVNDGTVAYICKSLINLQSLEIAGNSQVTDFGFTGIPEDPLFQSPTFPLKNLKGLKSLVLKRCTGITDLTCLLGICFNSLAYLDLFGNTKITKEGIMEIMRNNRCLETLRSSKIIGLPYADEIRETLNPRFKTHIVSYRDYSDDESLEEDLDLDDISDMVSTSDSDIDVDVEEEEEEENLDEDLDSNDQYDDIEIDNSDDDNEDDSAEFSSEEEEAVEAASSDSSDTNADVDEEEVENQVQEVVQDENDYGDFGPAFSSDENEDGIDFDAADDFDLDAADDYDIGDNDDYYYD